MIKQHEAQCYQKVMLITPKNSDDVIAFLVTTVGFAINYFLETPQQKLQKKKIFDNALRDGIVHDCKRN